MKAAKVEEVNPRFILALKILLGMILSLMALGAAVRTMNAGLSCPDWPLCFGQVIPDFHPAVWFEFVHRAYAGLVSIAFLSCAGFALWSPSLPKATKRAAVAGIVALLLQIVMGGLTVLLLVKAVIVTGHLFIGTLFFVATLWMYLSATRSQLVLPQIPAPRVLVYVAMAMATLIFVQIIVGGFVASTYAGSVCVDWPLCNGQWVPTWTGAIGLQIFHRLIAYTLALFVIGFAAVMHLYRHEEWMTPNLRFAILATAVIVILQVAVGIANLLLFIPPWVTVVHQSLAILLLTAALRQFYVLSAIAPAVARRESPAENQVLLAEIL